LNVFQTITEISGICQFIKANNMVIVFRPPRSMKMVLFRHSGLCPASSANRRNTPCQISGFWINDFWIPAFSGMTVLMYFSR